jgi:hypothetical protein
VATIVAVAEFVRPLITCFLLIALAPLAFRKFIDFQRGFERGFDAFEKASLDLKNQLKNALDQSAHDAGKSLGGIYGKPAAQALTPDNFVAELYNPAAFGKSRHPSWFAKIGSIVLRIFSGIARVFRRFARKTKS